MKFLQLLLPLLLASVVLGQYHHYYPYPNPNPKPKPPTPTPPPPTPPPVVTTPPLNVQECHDNLGELMDGDGNTLMTNTCEPFVDGDNETQFKFTISFLAPYQFNDECLDLEVIFENTTLAEGAGATDEWSFDPATQEITWNIKLSDFVDVYGCEWVTEDDQFTWICDFKVNILFMDMVQQCYSAKLQVTVDRIYDGELTVNVEKNTVVGVCCENELNIETELRFCTTFECTDFLPSPITVIRKTSFFVEHRIVTPGFQNFYLSIQSVTLSNFLPVIVQTAVEAGRTRIELRSNIAKPDLVLTVISQLEKVDPNNGGRRFLNENIRDDYKVKTQEQMTIVNPKSVEQLQQKEQNVKATLQKEQVQSEEKLDQDLLLGSIIAASVLIAIILSVSVYLCTQKKNKYEEKSATETEMEINSN